MPDKNSRQALDRRTQRKQNWEARWADPAFAPFWLREDNDPAIEEDLRSGWFRPGSRILDIGCGRGEIAFALAQAGMNVLGIDVAKPAILQARKRYMAEGLKLKFRVGDITSAALPAFGKFDYLIDRGCLHSIPENMHEQYVQNIEALARKRSALLILHKIEDDDREKLKNYLIRLLNDNFKDKDVQDFWFDPKTKTKAGLKLKLVRTSS